MPLAGFGDRFLAYLLDSLILTGFGLGLTIPLVIGMVALVSSDPDGEAGRMPFLAPVLGLGWFLLIFVMYYVYYVEMFGRTGNTWGKRALKIQIMRLDNPGTPVDRGVLTRRWAVQILAGIFVPFFSYLDGLWQLWDKPYQQCLHDKAAGTIVVKAG